MKIKNMFDNLYLVVILSQWSSSSLSRSSSWIIFIWLSFSPSSWASVPLSATSCSSADTVSVCQLYFEFMTNFWSAQNLYDKSSKHRSLIKLQLFYTIVEAFLTPRSWFIISLSLNDKIANFGSNKFLVRVIRLLKLFKVVQQNCIKNMSVQPQLPEATMSTVVASDEGNWGHTAPKSVT